MSFNVRLGVADDGEDSWEHRKALLARTIQDFDPDLLGTQETWGFQAEYMLSQLPGREYVGWPRQPGNEQDGEECGILYRTARFERVDAGQFWLSETPDVPASKSWDSSLPRIATWVRLRERRTGSELVFREHPLRPPGGGRAQGVRPAPAGAPAGAGPVRQVDPDRRLQLRRRQSSPTRCWSGTRGE